MAKRKIMHWSNVIIVLLVVALVVIGGLVFYFVQKDLNKNNDGGVNDLPPKGEIYTLEHAYSKGWLLKEDLLNVAYNLNSTIEQIYSVTPIEHSLEELDEQVKKDIQDTIAYNVSRDENYPFKYLSNDNVKLTGYFGRYNVFYIVTYEVPFYDVGTIMEEDEIGRVKFVSSVGHLPVVFKYKNEEIEGSRSNFYLRYNESDYMEFSSHEKEFELENTTIDLYFGKVFGPSIEAELQSGRYPNEIYFYIIYLDEDNNPVFFTYKTIYDYVSEEYRWKDNLFNHSEKVTIPKDILEKANGEILFLVTNLTTEQLQMHDSLIVYYRRVLAYVYFRYEIVDGMVIYKK